MGAHKFTLVFVHACLLACCLHCRKTSQYACNCELLIASRDFEVSGINSMHMLQGVSGVAHIEGFNTEGFSTRFAGEIRELETNGYVNKKMERRMDDTIKYIIVAGKKVCTAG